ncbi:hypothetical protein A3J90_08055 [candidate division WOR-1 bacterium RIFOXYC2_FULL_37_10]|uniref:Uncharacterized protein n=1 Tax=candidate division WOR-1 bacterium RIFOXYB2_FULL_37_13 TaxID=1802579 RepID=A0A1F4SSQ4_UNCSA|nr:MAG: hypothetical protein A2310_02705 [candidate division WOR-1 bacterium RIFOXYB2_FULL_37_13]OGC37342.1 MAG: hypothetical protein A3J90_08055 [candidate division WOR-1 bacterium RIFOXYC2_FULL_37_10]
MRKKAVIIAGGLGTRLRPLTYDTPKPIVPIVNQPLIVHQIELLKRHGIVDIILNLHYLPNAIKKILGNGSALGVKLYYSIEKEPLGTAGAVKNAEEFFGDCEVLVVFNGDILYDINISKIIDFHTAKQSQVTLALTSVEDPTPYGLVLTDENGKIKDFLEKPSWNMLEGIDCREINAGVYVLDPKVFSDIPKETHYMFEHHLFPKMLSERAPMYAYKSDSYWIDVGNAVKYYLAHEAILRGEMPVRIFGDRNNMGCWVGKKTEIDKTSKVFCPVVIGEGVKLGKEVILKDYTVVGDNVEIGEGATLERCIIWRGVKIGKHVKLSNCIIGFDCKIEDCCVISGAVLANKTHLTKGSKINV